MRRGNLLTLRKFFNWRSSWCTKYFYKSLLYKDLFIHFYINSIFLKLKYSTSSAKLNYLNSNIVLCNIDIYIHSISILKKYLVGFFKRIVVLCDYINYYLNSFLNTSCVILDNSYIYKKVDLLHSFYITIYNKYKYKLIKINNAIIFNKYLSTQYLYNSYFIINFLSKYLIFSFLKDYTKLIIIYEYHYDLLNNCNDACNLDILVAFSLITYNHFFIITSNFINCSNYKLIHLIHKNINNYIILTLDCFLINILFDFLTNLLFRKGFYFSYLFFYKFNLNKRLFIPNLYIINNFKNDINIISNKKTVNKTVIFFFYIYGKLFKYTNLLKDALKKKHILLLLNFKKKYIKRYINIFAKEKHLFFYWFFKKIWLYTLTCYYVNYYKYIFKAKFMKYVVNYKNAISNYLLFFIKGIKIVSNLTQSYFFIKNISFIIKIYNLLSIIKSNDANTIQFLKYMYVNNFLKILFFYIEKSITLYNNSNIRLIFMPNIFFFYKPFMTSAKLIAEYLYFKLKKKINVNKVFVKLKKWQLYERFLRTFTFNVRKQDLLRYSNKTMYFLKKSDRNLYFQNNVFIRAPLRGLRCVCSGPPYKAKRKIRLFYHIWVANFSLTGRMPLQQFQYKIDYYQTFVVLKRATIGLKVWLLLESYVQLK